MKTKKIRLQREPDGSLTLIRPNGKRVKDVRVAVLNPMQIEGKWYEIQGKFGKSLEIIRDPDKLDKASRALLKQDTHERYVMPRIKRIVSLRQESHISYWEVETDRGPRDFVLKEKLDNILEDDSGGFTLKDVNGNYFVIKNPKRLDKKSRRLFGKVI